MNERKARVNKYPRLRHRATPKRGFATARGYGTHRQANGRYRSREYNLNKTTRIVNYPSDHRVEKPKGLTKFIRNWLF